MNDDKILNEVELKKHCNKYGYKYRYFFDTAVIMTGIDMWKLLEKGIKHKRIVVEHYNKTGNKKGKLQFHSQRVAYDLEWIFENIIVPHQSFTNVYNETFKIKDLLAQM